MTTNALRRAGTTAIDRLLDTLVVPGYSSIGPALRRHWWPDDPAPLTGRPEILVTGAGSGLGEAASLGLARLGARVRMVGRNESRLTAAAGRIRALVPDADLSIDAADVSDLTAVGELAARVPGPLRGVVHGAGLIPPERVETAQGHEMAFATHVLGPFALTLALRDRLRQDGDGRVIWVSSGGMYSAPLVTDLEYRDGEYRGIRAYARTKRMQVVLAELLAAHFDQPGDPVVHSMHPGWAATAGINDSIPGFAKVVRPILRTPEQGADTIVWLAATANLPSGPFWHDRLPRRTHYLPWQRDDPTAREHLWMNCRAVGETS